MRGKGGERKTEIVRVIDWEKPEANDFFLASQVWFAGELYTKRADLVGFVNGLPLLFVELKASHKAMADAFDGNLSDYRTTIPQVFTPNAFVILSNGVEAVLGAPYAPLEFFNEWKRIDDEEEAGVVSLDTLIKGTCRPARFLDLVENFIAFEESKLGLVKKLAKTHQLLGVNRALEGGRRDRRERGAARRLLAHAGLGQEPVDAVLRPQGSAQEAGRLDFSHRHRPRGTRRPDRRNLRRLRRTDEAARVGAGAEPRASEGAVCAGTSATSSP